MKALSIKQPWLYCITDLVENPKRIENRTWKPRASMIGETIALHASKGTSQIDFYTAGEMAWEQFDAIDHDCPMPRGAIVATAKIVSVVTISDDFWFAGPFGWVLDDVERIPDPIPCRGALGLWTVPPSVLEAVGQGTDANLSGW